MLMPPVRAALLISGAMVAVSSPARGAAETRSEVPRPVALAERFHSETCRNAFGTAVPDKGMPVYESGGQPWHGGFGFVVVCPKQKLVYVQNCKAGSSSIRAMLESTFGCDWRSLEWAPDSIKAGLDAEQRTHMARTDWLNETIVSEYIFFTAVREPFDRFRSSYRMVLFLHEELRGLNVSAFARRYRTDAMDAHAWTQSRLLSGVDDQGRQVPLHFIARLENLDEDISALWQIANLRKAVGTTLGRAWVAEDIDAAWGPPTAVAGAAGATGAAGVAAWDGAGGNDRGGSGTAAMTTAAAAVDGLTPEDIRDLCTHLWQDYRCFDYPLPEYCRQHDPASILSYVSLARTPED